MDIQMLKSLFSTKLCTNVTIVYFFFCRARLPKGCEIGPPNSSTICEGTMRCPAVEAEFQTQ